MPSLSGFYENQVVGDVRPPAQATHWRIDRPDPSGYRHRESGVYKPSSKVRLVGGMDIQAITLNTLDFGNVSYTSSGWMHTDTLAITLNQGEVNSNTSSYFYNMSGVNQDYKLFNMKFWMPYQTAFSGFDSTTFYYKTTRGWLRGDALTRDSAGITVVPSSLPSSPNIYAGNDVLFVSGVHKDVGYSHYLYLFGAFSGSAPLGTYGTPASDDFLFRITYDWTNKEAAVLDTDFD